MSEVKKDSADYQEFLEWEEIKQIALEAIPPTEFPRRLSRKKLRALTARPKSL